MVEVVRRNIWRGIALSIVALSLAACDFATAPTERGNVLAVSRDNHVHITNQTATPVFTVVFGRNVSTLVDWAPCVDANACPPIAPGETLKIAYPRPLIDENEREAIVYWWHATRSSRSLAPDSLRFIIVPL